RSSGPGIHGIRRRAAETSAARRRCRSFIGCVAPDQLTSWNGSAESERLTGIEPAYQAWEACALPLSYSRMILKGPEIIVAHHRKRCEPVAGALRACLILKPC